MSTKTIVLCKVHSFTIPTRYNIVTVDQDGAIYAHDMQPEVNRDRGIWLGGAFCDSIYLGRAEDDTTRHRWDEKIFIDVNDNNSRLQCVWRW